LQWYVALKIKLPLVLISAPVNGMGIGLLES